MDNYTLSLDPHRIRLRGYRFGVFRIQAAMANTIAAVDNLGYTRIIGPVVK